MADDQTSTVRGDAELIARAGHLFDVVHEEFLCAARDLATWSQPEARSAIARRVLASGPDRFTVRKLWSPLVLADEAQRAHLRRLDAAGAQVRISSAPLPRETIILDRRVAILAGPPSPRGREYTVTTSPILVGAVYSLFTAAWDAAIDLGACLRGEIPELAPEAREILRALGAGLTDEAAARRLGTSLRTYRRRVAELMAALEAGSRFQAGVRAGELGLAGSLPQRRKVGSVAEPVDHSVAGHAERPGPAALIDRRLHRLTGTKAATRPALRRLLQSRR